ncbi:hypothetical protein GCM10010112_69730 [Actinoplanes lobatus]|uniref:Uncharacterized protein n=1 Tax=Actinoplanes lobatus TaxID=113568 RepID=A0A7W7HM51_9ACTN|nr:hypothetical protein [Actinoplanes lobatus]MBB4753050.1 hypothetical protein [Actinoplanes lobatus]GGN87273.1 hypothetical protein GCM10010112_69730 [Actinoplanes lobatus]GIE39657.1 hypothetical protein Alo02nite_25550 [Actinoplanes lobatus]
MTFLRSTIGAVCAAVLAATPAMAAPPPGELELLYLGDLTGPAKVADSSGKNLHGDISTGGGGTITAVDGFLRFPGGSCTAAPCPQAIIKPTDTVTLRPGDGRFVYAANIRLTEPPSSAAGMNVFQFGAAGAGVSQWKLQVDSGRPSCRWSDGTEFVLLPADLTLTVGRWYRVTCYRLSPVLFQIRVNDPVTGRQVVPPAQQTGKLRDILPSGAVVIGGKRINPAQSDVDTDQFHGDLDDIEFGRRILPSDD